MFKESFLKGLIHGLREGDVEINVRCVEKRSETFMEVFTHYKGHVVDSFTQDGDYNKYLDGIKLIVSRLNEKAGKRVISLKIHGVYDI